MALSPFEQYKQKSASQSAKILEDIKNGDKKFKKDERFWRQTTDKAGNGKAILRFLPAPVSEDLPYVKLWTHSFKGPHGYYIENSLTTLDENDPLSEWNNKLWNTEVKQYRDMVSKQKRRLQYIANVLIVKDFGNPANDGKVMLYQFGKKIHEKMVALMQPKYEGETSVNPFDIEAGCNFTLRIKKQQDFPNYDDSTFDPPTPLCGGNVDKINDVLSQVHSLTPFLDKKVNFKSYDELRKRLLKAVGEDAPLIDFLVDSKSGSARPTTPAPSAAVSNRSAAPVEPEDEPIAPAGGEDVQNIDDYLSSLDAD